MGLDSAVQDDLLISPDSTNGSPPTGAKTQKKIHQVSQSDNPTKITIKTFEVPSGQKDRPSRKRRQKEFASPNSDSRIYVVSHDGNKPEESKGSKSGGASGSSKPSSSQSSADKEPNASSDSLDSRLPMCSITISFDLNTQKLWDDLHLPYETYTSFFRHLILLEKYFRNGDLVLSENASQKSSSYIRSLQNRIEEYEVKHKRSHADLSASTRPDLSIPAPPSTLDLLSMSPPATRTSRASSEREPSPVPSTSTSSTVKKDDGSTILRIPKVSMPSTTSAPPAKITSPPPMPTKLRVRKDLMYLGLMANKGNEQANIMIPPDHQHSQIASKQLADLINQARNDKSTKSGHHPKISNPPQNLMQLLNDPTLKQKAKGPSQSKTSMVSTAGSLSNAPSLVSSNAAAAPSKSSNSQLFKNSESSGSSAIPLTFNNSIAEVLAAAAKSKSREASASSANQQDFPQRPPEVTITAKSFNKSSMSGGENASMQAKKQSSSATFKNSNKDKANINPLMDMSKLLQTQSPAIPPHLIAQNTLAMPTIPSNTKPISTHQMAGTMPKIAPKLTASLLRQSISTPKPCGISTVNKKSLNNVLDRLSGLKGSPSGPQQQSAAAPSTLSGYPTSTPSSLVQQLQAPPIMTPNQGLTSPSKSNRGSSSTSTSSASNALSAANLQSLQTLMASQGLFGMGFPGTSTGLQMGQPMVQNPWSTSTSPSAQQAALAEAHRTLTLAGAGMPGMNQAAAAAALSEIFKLRLQAQQDPGSAVGASGATAGSKPNNPGQAPRLRAPPPLTHMGRSGLNPPSRPNNPE